MSKLTDPQKYLLEEIEHATQCVGQTYRPAQALVAQGLARWRTGRFNADWLEITEEGREWLQKERQK